MKLRYQSTPTQAPAVIDRAPLPGSLLARARALSPSAQLAELDASFGVRDPVRFQRFCAADQDQQERTLRVIEFAHTAAQNGKRLFETERAELLERITRGRTLLAGYHGSPPRDWLELIDNLERRLVEVAEVINRHQATIDVSGQDYPAYLTVYERTVDAAALPAGRSS